MRTFNINNFTVGNDKPFVLIAGPCQIESQGHAEQTAGTIKEITDSLGIKLIYKSSFDKANRSSVGTKRGVGIDDGLQILNSIKHQFGVPILTDIHESYQAQVVADAGVDVIQIPAFLCRQTDLLLAAAATNKIVNVKKGQFLSGPSMKFAAEKIKQSDNEKIILTERGNSFGYQDLIVDYRNITWMKEIGVPVVMDCTHSLQQPNQTSGITGGNPQLIETIAKAAIATGADGLFIETHPRPAEAKSDGANMLPLDLLEPLLKKLISIRKAI